MAGWEKLLLNEESLRRLGKCRPLYSRSIRRNNDFKNRTVEYIFSVAKHKVCVILDTTSDDLHSEGESVNCRLF